ncbi:uracil-DNA glycosylase [Zwartia sp.]|uniref:uracil-DNA glycosylase n=1 Tax=Zwartia sp. TaxID=2978004 RepID=UPI00271AE281|nr:uracil-DNA glycosylase [Zwartia sp.]MDO9025691.1 uracil-DNA glycosylase [Zwartia sp.]
MFNDNELEQASLWAHLERIPEAWQQCLAAPDVQAALAKLSAMLEARLAKGAVIYPARPFRALESLEPNAVKVVILGQDPYHGPGQAQGLAFSVPDGFKRPPSLRNIFQEIEREFPTDHNTLILTPNLLKNDLSRWADQGVLLLNTCLTVESGQPASHAGAGWETVTDALIASVSQDASPKVFMLWGSHAQAKRTLIADLGDHLILMANHPSPLSARRPPTPFIGCNHFQLANAWLTQHNLQVIDWQA